MDDPWMGVDETSSEAGADVGEGVDGLHDARVGGVVEGVDPVADLVDDVDLPLARPHSPSVPIAILVRRRTWQDRRPWQDRRAWQNRRAQEVRRSI